MNPTKTFFETSIGEAEQNFNELKEEFHSQYHTTNVSELNSEGIALLIQVLKAKLEYKKETESEYRFNRYFKPVILMQISKAHAALDSSKFLEARV